MIFPTQCPVCLNMEFQKTMVNEDSYPKRGLSYWFYCGADITEDCQLWHFAIFVQDDKLSSVTYADRSTDFHVRISLEKDTTQISKITGPYYVDTIQTIPYAIKMDYYNYAEVSQKLKLLATYL